VRPGPHADASDGWRGSPTGAACVRTRAVFFDVDFTLIHPGPAFQGTGYRDFCARHGVTVDPELFPRAVANASVLLDSAGELYDPRVFIAYTRRIIENMGGSGDRVEHAARDIYDQWSSCDHFMLYEDVPDVLAVLNARGLTIGLISNTQRCLTSFQSHFALEGLIAVTVSSAAHGYMKPHPSIFRAALQQAGASPHESVMVGDSVEHDVAGARGLGMRAVLVSRSGAPATCPPDVPVISTLRDLPPLV
jgi:HAD superfamily hydrolase (TIGR01662 family)